MKRYWYAALGVASSILDIGWITTILGAALIVLIDVIFHWEDL